MGRLARLCAVGTFQILISTAARIGLIRIIATFGSTVVAGYGIAMRIVIFALLPAFGLSNAAATMVGQSRCRQPGSCRTLCLDGVRYNLAFLGAALGVVSSRWHRGSWPRSPPSRRSLGWRPGALRIIALGFPLYAFGMVMSQSFNGAGDTRPRPINLFVFWLFEIPPHTLANHTALSYRGGFVAVTVAYCALALVSGWLFRRGRWKMKQV